MHWAMAPATLCLGGLGPGSRNWKFSPTPWPNWNFFAVPSSTHGVLQLWSNRTWSTCVYGGYSCLWYCQGLTTACFTLVFHSRADYDSVVPGHPWPCIEPRASTWNRLALRWRMAYSCTNYKSTKLPFIG